jgi:hypothetical protein
MPHVSHTREPIAAATDGSPAASAAAPAAAPPPAAPPPTPPTDGPPAAAGPPAEKPASTPLAPDLRVTVPPDKAPKAVEHPSFVLTDAVKALDQEKETKSRIKPAWIIAAVAVAAVAVVAVILLSSGGSSGKKAQTTQTTQTTTAQTSTTAPTTTTPPLVAEIPPTAIQQQSIAGAGGDSVVVASPGGAIERLSGATLKPQATTTDPAGPTSISQSYGRVFVTDSGTIATYKVSDLSPIDAVALPGAYALAGGGANLPLYAISRRGVDGGQLCAVTPQAVSPCVTLPFAPSGGGVQRISSEKSVVYLTDRASASVIPYTATKSGLTAGTPIHLPQQPQGDPIAIHKKLYVPIRRGIAVVDTGTGKVTATIALPVSPLSLVASPSGKVFAALFSTNQLAVVDPSKPAVAPVFVKVQKGPIALAASGGSLYVVNGATDSAQKINPDTLSVTGVSKLPSLGSNTPPITAQTPRIVANGRTVTVTLPLHGGTLPASGLVVSSTKISGGHSAATLWQGGIKTKSGTRSAHGVSVTTSSHPGRVDVVLHTRTGDFEKVVVARAGDGRAVSFTLTEPPPAPPPTSTLATTTPQTFTQTTTTPTFTQTTSTPAPTSTSTPPPTSTSTPPPTSTSTPPPTHTTTQTFTVG